MPKLDPRPSDQTSTPDRIRLAAEQLFADQGVASTSTRSILNAAGQRNESALQYHFGGRDGLIEAIYRRRGQQVDEERKKMLVELNAEVGDVDLRRVCEVALLPAVRIARRDPTFARFLSVVAQVAFAPSETLRKMHERYEIATLPQVAQLIRERLDLPQPVLRSRLELVHRIAAMSLAQRARTKGSFRGRNADRYFDTVLDAMTAVLTGPISGATARNLSPNGGGR